MGKSLIIKGADFSTNGISKSLDAIAYESFSYRDIFETNNLLGISPGFEDGTYTGLKAVAGNPVITDSIADTGTYSLKCFGNTSCQVNRQAGALDVGNYFAAARVNCVRYVTGFAGAALGTYFDDCINHVTNEFVTVATKVSSSERIGVFYGSFSSADLDCYIDTPVCIDLSIFSNEPSKEMLTLMYDTYIKIKKKNGTLDGSPAK